MVKRNQDYKDRRVSSTHFFSREGYILKVPQRAESYGELSTHRQIPLVDLFSVADAAKDRFRRKAKGGG